MYTVIIFLGEKIMLVLTIICLVLEFVFFFVCSGKLAMLDMSSLPLCYVMTVLLFICTIICIIGLPIGISGIKYSESRGKSIATTAVSAVGILTGLIFSFYSIFLIKMVTLSLS